MIGHLEASVLSITTSVSCPLGGSSPFRTETSHYLMVSVGVPAMDGVVRFEFCMELSEREAAAFKVVLEFIGELLSTMSGMGRNRLPGVVDPFADFGSDYDFGYDVPMGNDAASPFEHSVFADLAFGDGGLFSDPEYLAATRR